MSQRQSHDIPAIEWVMAALGLLLLIAAIVVIVRDEVHSGRPPVITIRVGPIHQADARWLVTFEAHNDGDAPAADLLIQAVLAVGDSTESADAQLDYLPARSRRGGGVFFSRDPRAGRLTLSPVSYRDP